MDTIVTLRLAVPVAAAAAAIVTGGLPASAQEAGGGRAFRGVFAEADRPAREKLDLSLNLAEAYDSDTPVEAGVIDPTLIPGASTAFVGSAEYRREWARASVGATGSSAFRYYNDLSQLRSVSHSVGAGVSTRLGGRTTLFANQAIAYSPSYLYALFPYETSREPGQAVPSAPDYTVSDAESFSYVTTATLTRGLSTRNNISVSGTFGYTDFLQEDENRRDTTTSGASAGFSRNVTQHVGLVLGYRYRSGDFGYGIDESTSEHGIDAGVEYVRPVSSTRSLTFRVNLGTTALVTRTAEPAAESPPERFWLGSVDAAFAYPVGKTWTVAATYRRGTSYIPQLTELLVTDGASATIGGMLSSRVDFQALAGYSNGEGAVSRTGSQVDTYTATVRLRYGLTARTAAYVEYLYYFYNFGPEARLAPGLPPSLERNGIRGGLTFWLPALRR